MTKDTPEPKVDTLDYVFEHVESFTCRDEKQSEPNVLLVEQDTALKNHTFDRDNSLLQTDHRGRPAELNTQRKTKKQLGKEGDMLDYVFEHTESFICGEDGPEGATQQAQYVAEQRSDVTYKAAKQRVQNIYEPEDEIQLYYKPQRS